MAEIEYFCPLRRSANLNDLPCECSCAWYLHVNGSGCCSLALLATRALKDMLGAASGRVVCAHIPHGEGDHE